VLFVDQNKVEHLGHGIYNLSLKSLSCSYHSYIILESYHRVLHAYLLAMMQK